MMDGCVKMMNVVFLMVDIGFEMLNMIFEMMMDIDFEFLFIM